MENIQQKTEILPCWIFLNKDGELLYLSWDNDLREAIDGWEDYGEEEPEKIIKGEIAYYK